MPMTAPVYIEKMRKDNSEPVPMTSPKYPEKEGNAWCMSFVLPKEFDEINIPKPLNPSIRITTCNRRTIAVLTYTGNNTLDKMEAQSKKLNDWVMSRTNLKAISPAKYAGYDQPATIPFLKRNEIHIELKSLQLQ